MNVNELTFDRSSCHKGAKFLVIAAWLGVVFSVVPAGFGGDIIDADRRIAWSPGIPGGIPERSSVYCNVKVAIPGTNLVARGDGVTDDWAALQSAINLCPSNKVVFLPPGAYRITKGLRIAKNYVTVRGSGMGDTRIQLDSTNASTVVTIAASGGSFGLICPITNGYQKGSTALTVTNSLASIPSWMNLKVGAPVAICQSNDPALVSLNGITWGSFDKGQMAQLCRIVGLTNNTFYIDRPLYWDHKIALVPRVSWMRGWVEWSGIEDLTLETKVYKTSDSVALTSALYCWVKNVEVYRAAKSFVWLNNSLRCEVRGCYVHEPWDNQGGSGYGYHLFGPNSDHLIEDNIAYQCRHSFVLEGAVSGCVIAYNYSKDAWSTVSTNWVYNDLITHGAHPFYNLYEGNHLHKWSEDYVHGSSSHNTAFRNQITAGGDSTCPYLYGRWAVSLEVSNYYMNVVGNVLGWPGLLKNYEANDLSIYKVGYNGEGAMTVSDRNVVLTTYRHGNYDYASGSTVWDGSNTNRMIPNSLYLSAKPSFFGANPWPAIGPDLTPMVSPLPAQLRFELIQAGGKLPESGRLAPNPPGRVWSVSP